MLQDNPKNEDDDVKSASVAGIAAVATISLQDPNHIRKNEEDVVMVDESNHSAQLE